MGSRFHRHLTHKVSDGTPAPRWGAKINNRGERLVSPRPLWFIQKWMVREGRAKEHEELQQRWGSYVSSQNKMHWYLHEPLGPSGSRIFIISFDSFNDFENFFATMDKVEENVKFVGKWHSCIEPGSYNGFFWREREIE